MNLEPTICACSICGGKGFVEGATFKFRNYFPFFFAIAVIVGTFVIFGIDIHGQRSVPERLESSLTTILGTIVGFYFGGKQRDV